MYLKGMFRFEQQGSALSRYINYIEILVIGALLLMLFAQLIHLLSVDVWRQDSMYYVDSYKDKLISEGRWVNKLFFSFLKVIPAQVCILLSYLCLGYFVYSACQNVAKNVRYSLAVSLLCLNAPVFSVQLEWPETILFAFLLLPVAVNEAKKIPDYIYFPAFSILFFGTFSAFYFLLPLLFLRDLDLTRVVRLLTVWCVSFVIGYLVTNLIVHIATGQYIEIAGWRHPHPVGNAHDLWDNFLRVFTYFNAHMKSFYSIVAGAFFCALLFALFKMRSLNAAYMFLVSICCALSIYITVIPLGVIVQERTALSFWVASIVALFLVRNIGNYSRLFGLILIFVLGAKMGKASYESVKSYAAINSLLVSQIQKALPYSPEEMHNLFIVVQSDEAHELFSRIEKNIGYKHYFSESLWGPLNWVPAFKYLGYKNIIVCVNDEGGWCKDAVSFYKDVDAALPDAHIFVSYRKGNDVVFSINKAALSSTESLLKN